jgi:SAM-dependent methyltransferase
LDCSCGIGTQAIGLAQQGFKVYGTDISAQEIERARKEAEAANVHVTFGVADFRTLDTQVPGVFEVVISFDNSVPHLLTDSDLLQAFAAMRSKLKHEGRLFINVRDYDSLLDEKPGASLPQVIATPEGKRIYFQVWEWDANLPKYDTNLFILSENDGRWDVTEATTTYRALRRSELSGLLIQAGFQNVVWRMPEDTGYYQPIVSATAN